MTVGPLEERAEELHIMDVLWIHNKNPSPWVRLLDLANKNMGQSAAFELWANKEIIGNKRQILATFLLWQER